MKFIREKVLKRQILAGVWCNLASSLTTEMVGRAGYDWALLDYEHGPGDNITLLHQIQALEAGPTAAIVRVVWNEMPQIKRALDLGAAGVMVPYVQSVAEAKMVVQSVRYPPQGMRGAAWTPRCAGYGSDWDQYYQQANQNLLTIIQIETAQAVEAASDMAAIDGIDVLFIGPLDLSLSLGRPNQWADPDFRAAASKVSEAAARHGKVAGTLLANATLVPRLVDMGYTFLAIGSDGGHVRAGLIDNLKALRTATGEDYKGGLP